jgi:hypothetical protein
VALIYKYGLNSAPDIAAEKGCTAAEKLVSETSLTAPDIATEITVKEVTGCHRKNLFT